jgi:outer membrane protein OmpA-like peptidoglycan-associated protein
MNPLARKKWVHRQIDPVKDRVNELDELQAKNANDIKDVDARATAGINRVSAAAQAADERAAAAQSSADQANSLAVAADAKSTALNGTVSTLDQYQPVSSTAVRFLQGRTTLTAAQKADLDQLASTLASQKGYIVEVRGYSRAGVAPSQAMADSVVRYLVEAHQIPVYRIYRTGMGRVQPGETASADGEKPLTNGVRVTVLHNSLATMGGVATTGSAAVPANPAVQFTGVSNPAAN